jgi:hypothetical protein
MACLWVEIKDAIVPVQRFLIAGCTFFCVMRQGINAAQYADVRLASDITIPT